MVHTPLESQTECQALASARLTTFCPLTSLISVQISSAIRHVRIINQFKVTQSRLHSSQLQMPMLQITNPTVSSLPINNCLARKIIHLKKKGKGIPSVLLQNVQTILALSSWSLTHQLLNKIEMLQQSHYHLCNYKHSNQLDQVLLQSMTRVPLKQ